MRRSRIKPEDGVVVDTAADGVVRVHLAGESDQPGTYDGHHWPLTWWGRIAGDGTDPDSDFEVIEETPQPPWPQRGDATVLTNWRTRAHAHPEHVWWRGRRGSMSRGPHAAVWLTRTAIFRIIGGNAKAFGRAYRRFLSDLEAIPLEPGVSSWTLSDGRATRVRTMHVRFANSPAWWTAFYRLRWRVAPNPVKFIPWLVEDHRFGMVAVQVCRAVLADLSAGLGIPIDARLIRRAQAQRIPMAVPPFTALAFTYGETDLTDVFDPLWQAWSRGFGFGLRRKLPHG